MRLIAAIVLVTVAPGLCLILYAVMLGMRVLKRLWAVA